ncbi:NEL-type E3 ubiquitin ligase domain-containing protein [Pseudomonas brenneri]|uniref:NEL-type E3 ubiquitin ligase domain-containing protein n=1 Tax=Pseudomonas brenneri TaxID=129817 RepID=UPI003B9F5ACF
MTDSPALPATPSIHRPLLISAMPKWLVDSTPSRRMALKHADTSLPPAYWHATPEQRRKLHDCFIASFTAQTALDQTMSALQSIDVFARPLLVKALKDQYGVTLAPHIATWLSLKKSLLVSDFNIEARTYDFLKLELLQAALHNFEEGECEEGAFHSSSGFRWQASSRGSAAADSLLPVRLGSLKVHQFLRLCRSLDLGGKFQTYLKGFFTTHETTLRQQFIASQKAAMRAAAELALLREDITQADYNMVLSVIAGERSPQVGGKPVWICDLGLMKLRMTGCVLFLVLNDERVDSQILYIPQDPYQPLRRYTHRAPLLAALKQRLSTPGSASTRVDRPTAYQVFFSQFVDYADRSHYFSQFTLDAPDATLREKVGSNFPGIGQLYELISKVTVFKLKNFPPLPLAPQVPNPAPYLAPVALAFKGQTLGSDKVDLWTYLYEQHRDKSLAEAAAHAVPTADVDARVRTRKLALLLNIGMFGLGAIAGFVPVLGELMMAVMAEQLLTEVIEAAQEWNEGDRKAAKAHLIDLAQNLALLGVTAGGGKALSKLRPEPVIEDLVPVKLPGGQVRLWKPDLGVYQSDVALMPGSKPNALGQYEIDGRLHVRINNALYEKTFDPQLNKWRIKHPRNPRAYQPILEHNRAGAWRHSHERPLAWDRLTLLRRLGPITEGFSDEALSVIGDVSGVQDDLLRKVHLDGVPVPAVLADTLEAFRADSAVDELIGRLRRGAGLDSRHEYALPLAVEMPGWPPGRVLEVFEQLAVVGRSEPGQEGLGEELAGRSTRYGSPLSADDGRPTLKISRADLLHGKLAKVVLNGLDEQQVTGLLGSASSWGGLPREQVFNERLADYALQRQAALFDAQLHGNGAPVSDSGALQRRFPGLTQRAREELLDRASPQELRRLQDSGRVSARLDHQARLSMQQGRLSRAISGLHRDRLANTDSDRLALQALARLPGWPQGVRLEMRLGGIRGPLLDSIGDESAAVRRYLVKSGECFQAHDASGRALNSVPAHGRNLFQSILDALPDETRRALVPTDQGGDLQQALATYAREHREIIAHDILKLRTPRARPALRLPSGRLGYELSGRGELFATDDALIAHARSVYPNMSETEAQALVTARRLDRESDSQIWRLFANRQRELTALRTTLEQWAGEDGRRLRSVEDLIDCWRQGFDRDRAAHGSLSLRVEEALPEWQADFSHVLTLNLSGRALLAQETTALLQRFPNVQHLQLYVRPEHLGAVTERLASAPGITQLSFTGPSLTYSAQALRPLGRMAGLRQLSLAGNLQTLDVSGLTALRRLTVSGTLETWPQGILELEHLEFLDITQTQLRSVPDEMFTGHQRLWRGLQMNWSAYEPQEFMKVYEHLHDNPAHLVEEQRLVQGYCEGVLGGLQPGAAAFIERVLAHFSARGLTSRQRLEKVNSVREEHHRLVDELEQWSNRDSGVGRVEVERQIASEALLDCWRQGLEPRIVDDGQMSAAATVLDLSDANLIDLPKLPATGFTHVRSLNLSDIGVPLDGINTWLGHFPRLDTLNLARNNLAELPSGLVDLPYLRHLDLSHNWLVVTPAVQAQLSRLAGLVSLRLPYNPISGLDVSGLRELQILDLSHSAISDWPQGVLELPSLHSLDLSHSAVTSIPEAALQGHDLLLANTRLRGCRLSVAARADARLFARRYARDYPASPQESPLGIPRELLAQGMTGGEPEYFAEDMLRRPDLLVALPTTAIDLAPSERLQRLDPALDGTLAAQRIEELRAIGLDAMQIDARLQEWESEYGQWVSLLNEWMDVHGYQDGSWISALDRRRAADRLLESWRFTLRARPLTAGVDGAERLDLSGLSLGDLPGLPRSFTHVSELDLSRVNLTAQGSNEFLRAFSHVRSLTLSNNGLRALPEALGEFRRLRRLELRRNELQGTSQLQDYLAQMHELEWLDLGENVIGELELSGLAQLDTLYLQQNMLDEWPMSLLELPRLRTLDLRDNWVETLPDAVFEPQHRPLMAGTNLSGNRLDQQSCENLQVYLGQTGNGLGFSVEQLEVMVLEYRERDELGFSDTSDYSLDHPEIEPPHMQKAQWFAGVAQHSSKHRIWDELNAQEGSRDFFFSLSQLRHTEDFLEAPAELTQRVWTVLEAISRNPAMRRDLFARATALVPDVTCGDGRILLFNTLETRVLEFDALRVAEVGQDGAQLLKFARSMIRLEAVEGIAQTTIERRPDIDPVEIRLALRIGLAQRLELPRQPTGMLFGELSEVSQADLDRAYATIVDSENTPDFEEKLVGLEYWCNYLKKKYATDFSSLARELEQKTDALDERYPDGGADYLRDYAVLGAWSKEQRTALAIRLTRQERTALNI